MTFSFLWFVVGVAVGVNFTFAFAWLSLRRANRKAAPRYTVRWDTIDADPPLRGQKP